VCRIKPVESAPTSDQTLAGSVSFPVRHRWPSGLPVTVQYVQTAGVDQLRSYRFQDFGTSSTAIRSGNLELTQHPAFMSDAVPIMGTA
jgi:hypothetical protein